MLLYIFTLQVQYIINITQQLLYPSDYYSACGYAQKQYQTPSRLKGARMYNARTFCFTLIQVVQLHYAIGTITLR